jgi:Icc-related predicted phosphoesterase
MGADVQRADGAGDGGLIRIAAVGDIHIGRDTGPLLAGEIEHVSDRADLLLLAGDLTQHGFFEEGQAVADAMANVKIPVVAVLGNHDYHHGAERPIRAALERAGVQVLEGESTVLDVKGKRVGVGGTKGFGGGFAGACGTEFGEDEMKAFIRHSREKADTLRMRLAELTCDWKIALTHYAPCKGTLVGEKLEIYPFLGSYYLGEAIDEAGCQLAVHGHAHLGTERAITRGGIPVRNVARPVIKLAYKIYCFGQCEADHEVTSLRPSAIEARG